MFERFKRPKQSNETEDKQESKYIKSGELSSTDLDALSSESREQMKESRKHIQAMAQSVLEGNPDVVIEGDPLLNESSSYTKTAELSSDTAQLVVREWNHRGVGYNFSINGEIEGMYVQLSSGFDGDLASGDSRIAMSSTKLENDHLLARDELNSVVLYMDENEFRVNVIPGHSAEGTISSVDEVLGRVEGTLRNLTEGRE